MTDETYNGWTNYETWGVALILDNDEGLYNARREAADQAIRDAKYADQVTSGIWSEANARKYILADWLKNFTETLCGIGSESEDYGIAEPSMMAQQLLGAALSDVNWDEIAENYLSELAEA